MRKFGKRKRSHRAELSASFTRKERNGSVPNLEPLSGIAVTSPNDGYQEMAKTLKTRLANRLEGVAPNKITKNKYYGALYAHALTEED